MYNEHCHRVLTLVNGLEKKGRIGIAANDIVVQLEILLTKTLP